jgi:hypothetical protein
MEAATQIIICISCCSLYLLTAFRKFIAIFLNMLLNEIGRSSVFFLDLAGREETNHSVVVVVSGQGHLYIR